MPEFERHPGFEFTALQVMIVENNEVNRDLGFIILTSHADIAIVGSTFNLDIDSFVVKSVIPKVLRAGIALIMTSANLLKGQSTIPTS